MRTLNLSEYVLTEKEIESIKKSCNRVAPRRNRGKEDIEIIKYKFRRGKKAEKGFENIFSDQIKYDSSISKKYGCDFILKDNKKVDVISIDADFQQRAHISIDNKHDSDLTVLMKVTNNVIEYYGNCSTAEVYRNLQRDKNNDCYFVDVSMFKK